MHILHVVDSLDRGGLERVVCELSLEQRRRGHDAAVYCLHWPGTLAAGLVDRGVPVYCGHKKRGPDLRVMRDLARHARAGRPSIVHSHSMMPNYYACAARLAGAWSVPVVNTRHDMGSTRPNDLRERLYRLSVPLTRLAVMCSEQVHQRFVEGGIVPASKARVVLNGIRTDVPLRSDPAARAHGRHLLNAAEGDFVVGCVGRLVPLKNHVAAIAALARLAPHRPEARLVLLGDGPLRKELESAAAAAGVGSKVRFLGEVPSAADYLPGFDVFLMPSLTEGHSIALLEAAAAGLAVVATDVGGNPEIVAEGRTGLLVPPGDDAAIADALRRLASDVAACTALGQAARAWVRANVSVEAMADGYDRVYAEALGQRSRPSARAEAST